MKEVHNWPDDLSYRVIFSQGLETNIMDIAMLRGHIWKQNVL